MNHEPSIMNHARPSVATDAVVFGYSRAEKQTYVLLVKRGKPPFEGKWALPGGFLHMDEDAETGCRRELKEETGLKVGQMEQLATFTDPDRDPRGRVLSIVYYTLFEMKNPLLTAGDDATEAEWFPMNDLPELAFDHQEIIDLALKRVASLLKKK